MRRLRGRWSGIPSRDNRVVGFEVLHTHTSWLIDCAWCLDLLAVWVFMWWGFFSCSIARGNATRLWWICWRGRRGRRDSNCACMEHGGPCWESLRQSNWCIRPFYAQVSDPGVSQLFMNNFKWTGTNCFFAWRWRPQSLHTTFFKFVSKSIVR